MEKFYSIVNWDEPSGWLEDAKRRERWSWLNRPIFKIRVKYYRAKRSFRNPFAILMIIYVLILIGMFLLLLHPFVKYFYGYEMFPKFYD